MAVAYRDLREFIGLVDKIGDLRRVEGAALDFEIGAITEVAAGSDRCPALLFSKIPGQPVGNCIFTNTTVSARRAALALGNRSKSSAVAGSPGLEAKARRS